MVVCVGADAAPAVMCTGHWLQKHRWRRSRRGSGDGDACVQQRNAVGLGRRLDCVPMRHAVPIEIFWPFQACINVILSVSRIAASPRVWIEFPLSFPSCFCWSTSSLRRPVDFWVLAIIFLARDQVALFRPSDQERTVQMARYLWYVLFERSFFWKDSRSRHRFLHQIDA
jgi:hypothetical protein